MIKLISQNFNCLDQNNERLFAVAKINLGNVYVIGSFTSIFEILQKCIFWSSTSNLR